MSACQPNLCPDCSYFNIWHPISGLLHEVLLFILSQSVNIEVLTRGAFALEVHLSFESMFEIPHDGLTFNDLINGYTVVFKVGRVLQSLLDVIFESFIDEA